MTQTLNIAREHAALRNLSVKQLRARYRDLFGEDTMNGPAETAGLAPSGFTTEYQVHFRQNARKEMHEGEAPLTPDYEPGNVPRVARLMALAIRFEGLVQRGEVRDYADLARLGMVSRARITQIMNLLLLAPDIQEAVLDLPRTMKGHDPITEHHLRPLTRTPDWEKQRKILFDFANLNGTINTESVNISLLPALRRKRHE